MNNELNESAPELQFKCPAAYCCYLFLALFCLYILVSFMCCVTFRIMVRRCTTRQTPYWVRWRRSNELSLSWLNETR